MFSLCTNTMFSLCNRFIRETLSGNAEGYKVFCIQLDKSRFCTSTLPYFQPLFHKPETASVIISSSRLSESAPCSGCWVSCPSLFSAPFSGSIFHLLLHKEILFFLLPIAGAFLTICFDQTLAVDSVPPRAAFISSLPPLSIKQIFSKSYRAGYSLLKHVFCCLNWLFSNQSHAFPASLMRSCQNKNEEKRGHRKELKTVGQNLNTEE